MYMGQTFMYKMCKAMIYPYDRRKCDAIINLHPPNSVKDCHSFCGVFNFFLSSFHKDLRKHHIPIYEMQKKKIKFELTQESQTEFNNIRELLIRPPVLCMPTANDSFRLKVTQVRQQQEKQYFS